MTFKPVYHALYRKCILTATGCAIGVANDIQFYAASALNLPFGADLKLQPLANNGGLHPSIALGAGSAAVDAGYDPPDLTPGFRADVRGYPFARVLNVIDIGAFETQALAVDIVEDSNDNDFRANHFSLREAIILANLQPGAQTVTFRAGVFGAAAKTITLNGYQIPIAESLSITGPGANLLTVSANKLSRIFATNSPNLLNLSIRGLTLANGVASGDGGAILLQGDTLTLDGVVLTGNSAAGSGGALATGATAAAITLLNCTLSNNTAAGSGGGLFTVGAPQLVLRHCTVSGNSATGDGGGLAGVSVYAPGAISLLNCTVTANTSAAQGGGLRVTAGSIPVSLVSTILSGNSATASPDLLAGPNQVTASFSALGALAGLVLNPASANNLAPGISLNLGALGDYGGRIPSIPLLAGSPAIDAGANPAAFTADVRGFPFTRSFGPTDIGAYEVQPLLLTVDSVANTIDGIYAAGGLTFPEAIALANANPGPDAIAFSTPLFSTPQTIHLGGAPANPRDSLTVTGPGAKLLTLAGDGLNRILNFTFATGKTYTLGGLTISGGSASGAGGVAIGDNAVTFIDTAIANNISTGPGGGLRVGAAGSLTLRNCAVTGNTATGNSPGGGIYLTGAASLTVRNTTISSNSGTFGGGVTAQNTTAAAQIAFFNSTIAGNISPADGGGLRIDAATPYTLVSTIVAGNTGAATAPDLISGANQITADHSAIGSLAGASLHPASADNIIGATLNLGPLQDNGGPTRSHSLGAGSAAIDAGLNPANELTDQRGLPRTLGLGPDIGATERQGAPAVAALAVNAGATQRSRVLSLTVTFSQPVTLAANAFTLTRPIFGATSPLAATLVSGAPAAGQGRIDVSLAVNAAGQTVATLTFATNTAAAIANGVEYSSLSDGAWNLQIAAAAVTGADGLPLPAPYNSPTTGPGRIGRLFGDHDGDLDVDALDLARFRQTFGLTLAANPATFNANMDFDGDGDVDALDLARFRGRFGATAP